MVQKFKEIFNVVQRFK